MYSPQRAIYGEEDGMDIIKLLFRMQMQQIQYWI